MFGSSFSSLLSCLFFLQVFIQLHQEERTIQKCTRKVGFVHRNHPDSRLVSFFLHEKTAVKQFY